MIIGPAVERSPHGHTKSNDAKPVVWLHIGAPKTGTTALQVAFEASASTMLKSGWLYPTAGRLGSGHHRLASAVAKRRDYDANAVACFEELQSEVERTGAPRSFISSENFFIDINVEALARHLSPFEVYILAYIRIQEDWLRSYFGEFVKHPSIRFHDVEHDDHDVLGLLSHLADYFKILEGFAEAFGRDRLIVRNIDEPSIKRDLIGDVCGVVGLDLSVVLDKPQDGPAGTVDTALVAGASNVSLSEDELEIVRLSNSFQFPPPKRYQWLYEMQEVALLRRGLEISKTSRFKLGLDHAGNKAKLEMLRARNASLLTEYAVDRKKLTDLPAVPPTKPEPLDLMFVRGQLGLETLAQVTAALAARRSEFNSSTLIQLASALSAGRLGFTASSDAPFSAARIHHLFKLWEFPLAFRVSQRLKLIPQFWLRLEEIAEQITRKHLYLLTKALAAARYNRSGNIPKGTVVVLCGRAADMSDPAARLGLISLLSKGISERLEIYLAPRGSDDSTMQEGFIRLREDSDLLPSKYEELKPCGIDFSDHPMFLLVSDPIVILSPLTRRTLMRPNTESARISGQAWQAVPRCPSGLANLLNILNKNNEQYLSDGLQTPKKPRGFISSILRAKGMRRIMIPAAYPISNFDVGEIDAETRVGFLSGRMNAHKDELDHLLNNLLPRFRELSHHLARELKGERH